MFEDDICIHVCIVMVMIYLFLLAENWGEAGLSVYQFFGNSEDSIGCGWGLDKRLTIQVHKTTDQIAT